MNPLANWLSRTLTNGAHVESGSKPKQPQNRLRIGGEPAACRAVAIVVAKRKAKFSSPIDVSRLEPPSKQRSPPAKAGDVTACGRHGRYVYDRAGITRRSRTARVSGPCGNCLLHLPPTGGITAGNYSAGAMRLNAIPTGPRVQPVAAECDRTHGRPSIAKARAVQTGGVPVTADGAPAREQLELRWMLESA